MGCPKYLLSKLQKVQNNAARLIFRTTRSAYITPILHFLHWLPTAQRIKYKLSLLCFKIISHQASIYLLELFTLTLLPGSSALLQTPKCSEYNPSEQSPVVRALSLARLQLSGTNSLFMSTILLLSALLNLPWNLSLFSLVSLPWYATGVCVSMHMHANLCVRVHVCVHSCCMYWILTICICKECVRA